MCREKNCDIVIPRREVSRQHARLAVDESGSVWLSSLGKEPVCVNGQPAEEAVELYSGDQIEVSCLEEGTRRKGLAQRDNITQQCN